MIAQSLPDLCSQWSDRCGVSGKWVNDPVSVWALKRRPRVSASSPTLKRTRWYTSAVSAIRSTPTQVLYGTTNRLPTALDPIIFVHSVARFLREEIIYGDIFKYLTGSVNNAVSVAASYTERTI